MSAIKRQVDPLARLQSLPWEALGAARMAYVEELADKEYLTLEDAQTLRRLLNLALDNLANIEAMVSGWDTGYNN